MNCKRVKTGKAIMFASAKKIDNWLLQLIFNGQQIDGPTDKVLNMGSLKAKFEAYWDVVEIKER
jgi:transketolase